MNDILYGFDYLEYYLALIYFKFSEYPLIIRICISVVVLFFLAYFFLSFYILLGVILRKKEKKNTQTAYDRFYEPIVEIALNPETLRLNEIIASIKPYSRKKIGRNHKKTQRIAFMLSQIKGKFGDQINKVNFQNIQTAFGIPQFLERELLFGSDNRKILALKFIESLDAYVSEAILIRFLYHHNVELRRSARCAHMWISQTSPFRFFEEDLSTKLNLWDMIEMHYIINNRKTKGLPIPNLGKWANESIEEDMKVFFINEIKLLGFHDNCEILFKMIHTQSWRVRNVVIAALGALKCQKTEEKLIEMYPLQPEHIKQTIIQSISLIHSGDAELFLMSAYETAENQHTKLLSLDKLYNYSEKGKYLFEDLRKKALYCNDRILFEHVKCPFINSV